MKIIMFFIAIFICYPLKSATVSNEMTIYCTHQEICRVLENIKIEQGFHYSSQALTKISGDPHEFEPSSAEIKSMLSSPYLIAGPTELNPWIKKIIYQRSKIQNLYTFQLQLPDELIKLYNSDIHHSTNYKEALSHFWLYPNIYCQFKHQLEIEMLKVLKLTKMKPSTCHSSQIIDSLKKNLAANTLPIILTHDALYPLLRSLNQSRTILAIKGSGHHEEVNSTTIKSLFNLLRKSKVIWIIEDGIQIPPNIINKIRIGDSVIKMQTANSEGPQYFSILENLNEKLKAINLEQKK